MTATRLLITLVALAAAPSRLASQAPPACPTGPGAAFGVTAYQCSSCAINQGGPRTEYTFNAEPVILEAARGSPLRAGDVILAVNGQPITTRAGADLFTYPPRGSSTITIRRGTTRMQIAAMAYSLHLLDPNSIESIEVIKGSAAARLYGADAANGVIQIVTKEGARGQRQPDPRARRDSAELRLGRPIIVIDGVVVDSGAECAPSPAPSGRTLAPGDTSSRAVTRGGASNVSADAQSAAGSPFGFAISCLPSCTRARATDGTDYWKFDGQPPVIGVRSGGPAAMVGLRVGDIVAEIDGLSILSEEGALRFQRSGAKTSMKVSVLRDGKKLEFELRAAR